jgi:hypothetical protein
MLASLSSLAAETDTPVVKPSGVAKDASAPVPRLNLQRPYLGNYKLDTGEIKNLPSKSPPKIVVLAANSGYEKGWNNATKTYMFSDDVGLGSMRNNADVGPGLGLGIKIYDTMFWGAVVKRPEGGGLMPAIAFSVPLGLRGF